MITYLLIIVGLIAIVNNNDRYITITYCADCLASNRFTYRFVINNNYGIDIQHFVFFLSCLIKILILKRLPYILQLCIANYKFHLFASALCFSI